MKLIRNLLPLPKNPSIFSSNPQPGALEDVGGAQVYPDFVVPSIPLSVDLQENGEIAAPGQEQLFQSLPALF